MAKPTDKSPEMERALTGLFGHNRRKVIESNQCVPVKAGGCGKQLTGTSADFRDELSAREYRISGFCQACQDRVFGGSDE